MFSHLRHELAQADLAAIEIIGLPIGQPLWIGVARKHFEWRALRENFPKASFAGLVLKDTLWQIELPIDDSLEHRRMSLVGAENYPNVVYFPLGGRMVGTSPFHDRGQIIDFTLFRWEAEYESQTSLDSILLTVKALSPERYENCLKLANLALGHQRKRIVGFGMNGRLVVEGTAETGAIFQHSIKQLSSGEQQMLLLIAYVVAFLQPGGIVLLDEPDLHLHVAMVTQMLQTLEHIVRQRNGQLIVASHSERVRDYFSRSEEQIELSPWRGPNS